MKGIPGLTNQVPVKTDSQGNPLHHPNALEVLAGASTTDNQPGIEQSINTQNGVDSSVQYLSDSGALDDANLASVLDSNAASLLAKAQKGIKLDESDVKKLQDSLVKGVSPEGTDTAYLEREQYDSNLTALKLKRELMDTDLA